MNRFIQMVGLLATSSAPRTITITNDGSVTLMITATAIGTLGEFTIQSNDCIATFVPWASCAIDVVFASSDADARTATLSVTSIAMASLVQIPLSGTGVAAPTA